MTDAVFFRLLHEDDRAAALQNAVESLHEDGEPPEAHHVDPASFEQIPGSPFAYWVSEEVRGRFAELPPFEGDSREVRVGDHPGDGFRYLRLFWEISPRSALDWRSYQKGGVYSPYYSDIHLVADWDAARQTYRGFRGRPGRSSERPSNYQYFFRPGLTWPRRTTSGMSTRALPHGCIFADKGPAAFSTEEKLPALLGLMNSRIFGVLVSLHIGAADAAARSYEVGVVQRTPVPDLSDPEADRLGELALRCVDLKRGLDTSDETSHAFKLPALLQVEGKTHAERVAGWREQVSEAERELAESQREVDGIAFRLYSIPEEDRREIESEEIPVHTGATLDEKELAADLVSYALGCAFARWDVRAALDPSLLPDLADPFAPLPVCSPGTLVGPDGLPAGKDGIASEEWLRAREDAITPPPEGSVQDPSIPDAEYPLEVDRDGILADDSDHADDVVRRVREALELILGELEEGIEREICATLGVKDLRAYLGNPRRFFDRHVKQYSRSRRKAPIYWLLQSPGKHYGLWVYYHRLDPDLLFKALNRYVEPKIRLEETRLGELQSRRSAADGREARSLEKEIERQETILADVREFRDRLDRAAKLNLTPDLDDGVALNIAPLHELVPWDESGKRWRELQRGEHSWSSISRQLRDKGMVQ